MLSCGVKYQFHFDNAPAAAIHSHDLLCNHLVAIISLDSQHIIPTMIPEQERNSVRLTNLCHSVNKTVAHHFI